MNFESNIHSLSLFQNNLICVLSSTIKIWDLELNNLVSELHHKSVDDCFAWGDKIISNSNNGRNVRIWNQVGPAKWSFKKLLVGNNSYCKLFDENNLIIKRENKISMFNLATEKETEIFSNDSCITCITVLNYSNCISYCDDTKLKIFNTKTGTTTVIDNERYVSTIVNMDNSKLAFGCWKKINLWDISTESNIFTINDYSSYCFSAIKLQDGRLAFNDGNEMIKIWDVNSGKCTASLKTCSYYSNFIQLNDGRLAFINRKNVRFCLI